MRPLVYPADWLDRDPPPPLSDVGLRLLAEGDSWFTIGTLNLGAASNLLFKLELARSCIVMNCAYPGHTLARMVDALTDPWFDRLLRQGAHARYWDALLISGGGNDLIDAAQTPPIDRHGQPVPRQRRLLLQPAEVAANPAAGGAERFVSEDGWRLLADYLRANFAELARRRDQGPSRGRPLFTHTYAVPTVRPAGTVGAPHGWLHPGFVAYGIPPAERQAVADLLFARLRRLLLELDQHSGHSAALPNVHVFDSAALPGIVAAAPDTAGRSGDWINEIHLTPEGCGKVGRAWGASIDAVLATYP